MNKPRYPAPTQNAFPGLQPLIPLSKTFVQQSVPNEERLSRYRQCSGAYVFSKPDGSPLYLGDVESFGGYCPKNCYSATDRPFKMYIQDARLKGSNDDIAILLDRPKVGCSSSMGIFAGSTGQLLGRIEQKFTCFLFQAARFNLFDDVGNLIFILKAPYCLNSCSFKSVTFNLFCHDDLKTPVGHIATTYAGFCVEFLGKRSEKLEIAFPQDLSVNMKAVLLGAGVLIDFLYYVAKRKRR